jgi:outer membrane protein insertion porin family
MDTYWRLGFETVATLNSELQAKNYDINTYNFGLFLSYPLSPYLAYSFKYRLRNYDIDIPKKIIKDPANEDKITKSSERGILSGLGAALNYDSTDSAIKPHRGLRSVLDGEVVGLGGNANFFRTGFINSYFTPLWRRGYMKYRADFRYIVPFGKTDEFSEIPMSERFFLGGVASVRGYKDFTLGPHFEKEVDGHQKERKNDPTGGISSSLLSLEYIQEILPFMDIFTFIDAGYVVGVYLDLLGRMPITLGWGFPVNATSGETVDNHFFFSMGGQF